MAHCECILIMQEWLRLYCIVSMQQWLGLYCIVSMYEWPIAYRHGMARSVSKV